MAPTPENTAIDLAGLLARGPDPHRRALAGRIETLLVALEMRPPPTGGGALQAVERALQDGGPHEAWLALAVLTARLPMPAQVAELVRESRLDGPLRSLGAAFCRAAPADGTPWPQVEVVSGQVLVDVHDTSRNPVPTGIQRVARQATSRWQQDHEIVLIGWTTGFTAYRRLNAAERDAVLLGHRPLPEDPSPGARDVLVPWKCIHLVPELPAELEQAPRYQTVASYSRSRSGLIGFDCVPIMAAETTVPGMSSFFAGYLAAAAKVNRIATISEAAAIEYRGWRAMLVGAGQAGPDIRCVPLPVQATVPGAAALAQARDLLAIGSLPVVLSVGSHEPRKNHLALLHAAEVLWRQGLAFSLVFVGGNSWNSAEFEAQVKSLQAANRPVQTVRALPDELLWAAYRLAYCTVFASLHEGFGLPVAESLASGTPVITSNFGSMADIASQGGALLVNPRDDDSLTDALRQLLTDRPLRDRLAAQAATIPTRSWDQYAAEVWAYLVDGQAPGADS